MTALVQGVIGGLGREGKVLLSLRKDAEPTRLVNLPVHTVTAPHLYLSVLRQDKIPDVRRTVA